MLFIFNIKPKTKMILINYLIIVLLCGCSFNINEGKNLHVSDKGIYNVNIKLVMPLDGYSAELEKLIHKADIIKKYNINLSFINIPVESYGVTLNMMMASGDGPDVFEIGNEWLNVYLIKNWMADVSQHVDSTFLDRFPAWAIKPSKTLSYNKRDVLYTMPSSLITLRLIYNKELFISAGLDPTSPPKTLKQLKSYALQITDSNRGIKKYGFALAVAEEWKGFVLPMEMSGTRSGVYYFNFKEGKYDITVYRKWLQTMSEIEKSGSMFPGETSLTVNAAISQFSEGNIGMMFLTNNDISNPNLKSSEKCSIEVAMPPAIDDSRIGKGAGIIMPSSYYAVNKQTENLEEACKIWEVLYSDEFAGLNYKYGNNLPIMRQVAENSIYCPQELEYFKDFLPRNDESLYPNAPQSINDWSRVKAYNDAFKSIENSIDRLEVENTTLNDRFNVNLITKQISKDDFLIPRFDPKYPQK